MLVVLVGVNRPGLAQQDDFSLPDGVEKTPEFMRIPLPKYTTPKKRSLEEEGKAIEDMRLLIKKYYAESNYQAAEPIYGRYVVMLEKVGATDAQQSEALQNYADLLRKLHKDSEAMAIEERAHAILARSESKGIPFALKQFRLGMSLDDFSNLPAPAVETGTSIKPICSCDKDQTVEVINSAEDRAAKMIQCGYWTSTSKDGPWTPYVMTVAGIRCTPDFKFIEDKGAYKLFEISISFYSSNYDDMQKALLSKYGEPTGNHSEKVKTPMGNIFKQQQLSWDNGVSKIKLDNVDGTSLEKARLTYIHRQLFLVYAQKLNEPENKQMKHARDDL
jgi:hypothetical protein